MPPLILITCGPASEPIDAVRRITNFSTGELGVKLAEKLTAAGFRVLCCKGAGATWPHPAAPCETRVFGSNADLWELLEKLPENVAAIYHVAALSDFAVAEIRDGNGRLISAAKISSSTEELVLRLRPAVKLLPKLREKWPLARLFAWKYELEGNHADALEKGRAQMQENRTDGCVINGVAYGGGFGVLMSSSLQHFASKDLLCDFLVADCQAHLSR